MQPQALPRLCDLDNLSNAEFNAKFPHQTSAPAREIKVGLHEPAREVSRGIDYGTPSEISGVISPEEEVEVYGGIVYGAPSEESRIGDEVLNPRPFFALQDDIQQKRRATSCPAVAKHSDTEAKAASTSELPTLLTRKRLELMPSPDHAASASLTTDEMYEQTPLSARTASTSASSIPIASEMLELRPPPVHAVSAVLTLSTLLKLDEMQEQTPLSVADAAELQSRGSRTRAADNCTSCTFNIKQECFRGVERPFCHLSDPQAGATPPRAAKGQGKNERARGRGRSAAAGKGGGKGKSGKCTGEVKTSSAWPRPERTPEEQDAKRASILKTIKDNSRFGYQQMLQLVPEKDRARTPSPGARCSKRTWEKQVIEWKLNIAACNKKVGVDVQQL